jgi:poly(hydroxyalkanoate) depolymerase family esterase
MTYSFREKMLEATRLTQSGRLLEATALLQGGLLPGSAAAAPASADDSLIIDADASGEAEEWPSAPDGLALGGRLASLAQALRGLAGKHGTAPKPRAEDGPGARQVNGAQFLDCHFTGDAGGRHYKLYVPSGYHGQPLPLIVMLHGCTQSPEDFAAGTGMNEAAEQQTCLVAYPAQPASANMQKCWNWFREGDQQRDGGEPAILAGLTREIMRRYAVDPARVYIAGLSAGGAAAAIMGQTYPDLFAAIGVHSGLACGAARSMPAAFTAMQHGSLGAASPAVSGGAAHRGPMPAIIFHGSRDTTVNPRNGDAVALQAKQGAALATRTENGTSKGGRRFTRTLQHDAQGRLLVEHWLVEDAGHAWSGGSPRGSYTDPAGPDATSAMLRFFLDHRRQGVSDPR